MNQNFRELNIYLVTSKCDKRLITQIKDNSVLYKKIY